MTLNDLVTLGGIEFEGNVTVKQWDEEKETYNIFCESDINKLNWKEMDREIKYMYAVDNTLVIEVE